MSISKEFEFNAKVFQVGQFQSAINELLTRFHPEGESPYIQVRQRLPDGSSASHLARDVSPLEQICDLAPWNIEVRFQNEKYGWNSISFRVYKTVFSIHIFCDAAEVVRSIHDQLRAALALDPYIPSVSEEKEAPRTDPLLQEVLSRIDILERRVFGPSQMRCFLSYRFTPSTEPIALRLHQFMSLLDVEVLTGSSYEPRRISEKVLAKLNSELDFIILLVTGEGESLWTRDEIAAAVHKKLAVVPIVQEGAKFAPGLFGDIEYIPYSGDHIGDAFLKVLEAVIFLRKQRASLTDSQDDKAT